MFFQGLAYIAISALQLYCIQAANKNQKQPEKTQRPEKILVILVFMFYNKYCSFYYRHYA